MSEYASAAAAGDRRRHSRISAASGCAIDLLVGGTRLDAMVWDVSTHGLRLALDREPPAGGTRLRLRHPVAGELVGTRVWQDDGMIGVALRRPRRRLERTLQMLCLALNVERRAVWP